MALKALQNKKLKLEKKVSALDTLNEERNKALLQMDEAREILKKESEDVNKMEKSSLKAYVSIIAVRYDETLEKERQEMIEAKLKYDRGKEEFERLEEKVDYYTSLKEALETTTKDYNKKLNELKEKMLKENSKFKKLYETKSNTYDRLSKELIEIDEAFDAGQIVLRKLEQSKKAFDSAANWGIFDMVGGGILATMAKHNKINAGKKILNNVSQALKDYNRELKDVDSSKFIDMEIDLSEFLTFADYFFDGIFADFTVQSRINNVKSKIFQGINEIERINQKLTSQKQIIEKEKKRSEKEIDELLMKYI